MSRRGWTERDRWEEVRVPRADPMAALAMAAIGVIRFLRCSGVVIAPL
jgi:hypothetical protein